MSRTPCCEHEGPLSPHCWACHNEAEPPGDTSEEDDMCPNCQTPWKCNGPHYPELTRRGMGPA